MYRPKKNANRALRLKRGWMCVMSADATQIQPGYRMHLGRGPELQPLIFRWIPKTWTSAIDRAARSPLVGPRLVSPNGQPDLG